MKSGAFPKLNSLAESVKIALYLNEFWSKKPRIIPKIWKKHLSTFLYKKNRIIVVPQLAVLPSISVCGSKISLSPLWRFFESCTTWIFQKIRQTSPTKTKVIQVRTENILLGNFVGDSNCFFLMDVWSLMVLFVIKCCWFARFHSFNKIQRFTCFFRFTKMGPNLHEVFLHCRLPASDFSAVATSHNEQKGWEVEIVGETQACFGDDFWGEDWLFQILKTCYTDCLLFVTCCCLSVRFSYL